MSVTTGQAIECFHFRLKLCADSYNHAVDRGYLKAATSHKRYMEIHQIAIAALQEKAERENPQLLTLNELRQMNGQPVWIAEENAWGIVSVDSCGIHEGRPFATFRYDTIFCEYDIERRNLHCYRHKPEEVHNEVPEVH